MDVVVGGRFVLAFAQWLANVRSIKPFEGRHWNGRRRQSDEPAL